MHMYLAYKIITAWRRLLCRLFGVKTVGARALVVRDDQVLLIRHTYYPGWYTIGGGIDRGETPKEAIVRELWEEVGITPLMAPTFFGIYHNPLEGYDDYVSFYVVTNFKMEENASAEIAEKRWFVLDALPSDLSPATARRIEELLGQRERSEKW